MQLIERYIYDVTRRLKESERADVKAELESSIRDMLPDNYSEPDVVKVLTQFGPPKKLAEQYRQKPLYLISPALYDTYISTLLTVTVTVAVVFACMGAFTAAFGSLDAGDAGDMISAVVRGAVSFAFDGAFTAMFWVTLGFAIADRSGYNANENKAWSVDDLPTSEESAGIKISRVSTVVGAALTVLFTGLYIAFVQNGMVLEPVLSFSGTEIVLPFSQAAIERSVPFVIATAAAALVLLSVKFIYARWNLKVCAAAIIYDAFWLAIAIFILNWPDLLNMDLFARIGTYLGKDFVSSFADGGTVVYFPMMVVILVIITAIDIGTVIRNTVKSRG